MNKLTNAFKNGTAFIPFITCGDPDLLTTKETILEMVKNGADIIELGIPFSDPTAEGPTIQGANIRALENGITTDDIFEFVKDLRKEVSIPLLFMTYANVVFSYGATEFISKCQEVEINGIILPDLPFEEKDEFEPICKEYNVDLISLIAPTSSNRISMIAKEATGFIYLVSSLGVTGARGNINTDLETIVQTIKAITDVPCAIGFGISTPEQAQKMGKIADGVIVGSAIITYLEKYKTYAPKHIGQFVNSMKAAIK